MFGEEPPCPLPLAFFEQAGCNGRLLPNNRRLAISGLIDNLILPSSEFCGQTQQKKLTTPQKTNMAVIAIKMLSSNMISTCQLLLFP
jgi:hypothetical protein